MTDYEKIELLKIKDVLRLDEIEEILEVDSKTQRVFYSGILNYTDLVPKDNTQPLNRVIVSNTRATWQDIAKSLMCEISLNDSVANEPKG